VDYRALCVKLCRHACGEKGVPFTPEEFAEAGRIQAEADAETKARADREAESNPHDHHMDPTACPTCGAELLDMRGAGFNPKSLGLTACFRWADDIYQCVEQERRRVAQGYSLGRAIRRTQDEIADGLTRANQG
jgi:hypothetical protein